MNKPACMIPWVSLWPKPNGEVYPCCTAKKPEAILGNLATDSIQDVAQSKTMKQLRKTFLSGKLDPSICSNCILRESSQGSSMRTMINEQFAHVAESALNNTEADGTYTDFGIRFMDFVWSSKCNFKCVHCNPSVSSSLASSPELRSAFGYNGPTVQTLSSLREGLKDELFTSLETVESIHFNGGEPFLIDEHFELLDRLIDLDRTQVKLWIHTNGSLLNNGKRDVITYLKKFPNSKISMSHDGHGARGEFLREGYNDSKFKEVYQELSKVAGQVRISHCIHALNIWSLTKTLDWYIENDMMAHSPSLNMVPDPGYIRLDLHGDNLLRQTGKKIDHWMRLKTGLIDDDLLSRLSNISKSRLDANRQSQGEKKDYASLRRHLETRQPLFGKDCFDLFPEYSSLFCHIGLIKPSKLSEPLNDRSI